MYALWIDSTYEHQTFITLTELLGKCNSNNARIEIVKRDSVTLPEKQK